MNTKNDLISENIGTLQKLIFALWNIKFEKIFTKLNIPFEDFQQESFLIICENISSYDAAKSQLQTFVCTILNNRLKSWATRLNREKRKASLSIESLNQEIFDGTELIECVTDGYDITENITSQYYVEEITSTLSNRQKRIVCYLIEDYSKEMIAEAMSLPIEIIKGEIYSISKNVVLLSQIYRRNNYDS